MHQMTRIASRVSTHGSWYILPPWAPGCRFLVTTRITLPCLVRNPERNLHLVTGILGAGVDPRYIINWEERPFSPWKKIPCFGGFGDKWKISHCLQHSWSWPYESNIRPNSSLERIKNSDKCVYIYTAKASVENIWRQNLNLKHKYHSPYLYNARNGHLYYK